MRLAVSLKGNLRPSNFAEINQTTLDNYDLLPQVQSKETQLKNLQLVFLKNLKNKLLKVYPKLTMSVL